MGYYTVFPGNKPEDNCMLLYVKNAEDNINNAATKSSIPKKQADDDAGENPAELSDIQIIAPTPRIIEVIKMEDIDDDAEQSVIETSNSFPSVNFSTISPNNSSSRAAHTNAKNINRSREGTIVPSRIQLLQQMMMFLRNPRNPSSSHVRHPTGKLFLGMPKELMVMNLPI
uniref:Uncharacterized protein n=1 Tax=Daphnia galeata TaxID=27404 RepID=A0A8J2WKH0_9CRUS|nr:unnamed protein product [Daphnia galeata]